MITLKDGTLVEELTEEVELKIRTKCPDKWLLIDKQTGEAYSPCIESETMRWKKSYNAEWNIED